MNWQAILTDAGVTVAIIGFFGLLAKALIDFHASRPAAEKIKTETFKDVVDQLDRLEEKIIKLRADNDELRTRIDALEAQLDVKEAIIKKMETRLTEVLIYLSGLLKELDDKGVQYTPPRKGLLDTDPNIPKVGK